MCLSTLPGVRTFRAGCAVLAAGLMLTLGAQCNPDPLNPPAVTFSIDPALTSPDILPTVMSQGQERPVGLLRGPDGVIEGFVIDEVMIRAETDEELQSFLDRYNGVVLDDGSVPSLPESEIVVPIERARWYLVRVDLSRTSLDDLPANMGAAGIQGELTFSSDDAARLVSIVSREATNGAWANLVLHQQSVLEHPISVDANGVPTAFLDLENRFWMTEDDDPFTPGDQGLSIGVYEAWEYMAYKNVPPVPPPGQSVFFTPVRVAVIDDGFALDTSTGVPLLNNVDYFNSFSAPLQRDEANDDNRAGGPSDVGLEGGGSSAWHGQKAFGVCCAAERNQFGGAGVGGPVAQPILIRTGATLYSLADSVYTAGNMGAHVISISMAAHCGIICTVSDIFWDNRIGDSVIACTRVGAVVISGAGNGGVDLADLRQIPCELLDVICVGSIGTDKMTRHNFGTNVDISAPENILSTVTPESVAFDDNDFGVDEVATFSGTSCATPFVSGVVALMKAGDLTLKTDQVQQILQATANPANDPRVPRGYVDAFRAVKAVLPANAPPTVQITQPLSGQNIGWKNKPFFRTVYSDPEVDSTNLNQLLRFPGTVVITSSRDGELCRATAAPYDCTSQLDELTIGQHVITATATDRFGATATHQIVVTVSNSPPQPQIVKPTTTDALFSHIPVALAAFIPDPDELILDENVSWTSSIDGPLGTGQFISHLLSEGEHTITVTAVDGKGLSASDEVNVTVATGAGAPTPVIISPPDGELFGPGQTITLTGMATDPEDGVLDGSKLEWSSDVDGVLGTGNSIQVNLSFVTGQTPCETGRVHTITLKATDSDGHVVTVTIIIRIGIIC